jgi:hypothetical protein
MKDSTYFFWNKLLYYLLWRGRTYGLKNIPAGKPAVLVANHLDARGPTGIYFTFPVRVYTWVDGSIFDSELSAGHLRTTFTEEVLHLKLPLSSWLANLLSRIVIPLFNTMELIPVYRKDPVRTQRTYDRSLEHLSRNHLVLIFPEVHELPKDPRTNIEGFKHSFVRLGEMFHAQTGRNLDFIPITIHPSHQIVVGQPIPYNSSNPPEVERGRICKRMQDVINETYLQLNDGRVQSVTDLAPAP